MGCSSSQELQNCKNKWLFFLSFCYQVFLLAEARFFEVADPLFFVVVVVLDCLAVGGATSSSALRFLLGFLYNSR